MPKPFAAVLEASLILGTCTPAMAVQCGDRESLVEHLNDKFSERLSLPMTGRRLSETAGTAGWYYATIDVT